MKHCKICNATYPTSFTHCPHDGTLLTEASEWSEGGIIRGKYRILGKLGQGGMATVYKALHVGFDEVFALKVINPELASDLSFVKRFGQEAALARKLQHPNAVRVEDIDQADDGRPFIVMEFIEGDSLKDVIQREAPLAVPRVCRIAKQVAAALDAAHALGMIHRDIKPGNIILTRPAAGGGKGAEEMAKVLDFGIAKIHEAHAAAGATTLTRTGTSMGTPAYMSPEQAMGKTGDGLDGRADIYSLGIVMYEMLTGELPVQAETVMQMLIAQINTPPEPIRIRRPELSEGIGAVVMRCLEKDPARRPPSGASLIAQIEQCESGVAAGAAPDDVPTVATPSPRPAQVAPPVPSRPSKTPVGSAALLAVLAIMGFAWYLQKGHKPAAPSPAAASPVTHQQAPQAEPVPIPPPAPAQPPQVSIPAPAIGKSPAPQAATGQDADHDSHDSDVDDNVQKALKDVPMDPATKAQFQDIMRKANDLLKKGDFDGATAQYRRLAALGGGWLGAKLADKAVAAAAEEQKKALGHPDQHGVPDRVARQNLKAAIDRYAAEIRQHPSVGATHENLGEAMGKLGDLKGDERQQRQALRLDPSLATSYAELGSLHARKKDWSDAARQYRKAIHVKPDLAEAHSGLGDALGHMDDWQEDIAEQRVAIQQAPSLAIAHFRLATALEHEGDSDEALREYRRASELDPGDANFQANYQRLAKEADDK